MNLGMLLVLQLCILSITYLIGEESEDIKLHAETYKKDNISDHEIKQMSTDITHLRSSELPTTNVFEVDFSSVNPYYTGGGTFCVFLLDSWACDRTESAKSDSGGKIILNGSNIGLITVYDRDSLKLIENATIQIHLSQGTLVIPYCDIELTIHKQGYSQLEIPRNELDFLVQDYNCSK